MNIVITDGYTLNPGDLSWDELRVFGNLVVFERTAVSEIYERCKDAQIILTNKTPLNRESIEKLSHLKMIGVTATGYNIVDIEAAREKRIPVCNVPAYGTASVAQHTIALLLELTNQVARHAQSVREGQWARSKDWAYSLTSSIELEEKCLGIVGLGHIGTRTAQIAKALGMKIIFHTRVAKQSDLGEWMDIPSLFSAADVVSLHCPLQPANHSFVNQLLIQKMKPTAFLINTSRGQLIQEQDLADALNEERIAGAALDVLSSEPPAATNPLLSAKNCFITPHNAWMSTEARKRILNITASNIAAFLDEHPIHTVN